MAAETIAQFARCCAVDVGEGFCMYSDIAIFAPQEAVAPTTASNRAAWLPRGGSKLLAFSWTRRGMPLIGSALAATLQPIELPFAAADGVIGWSDTPSAHLARLLARSRHLPYWSVEEGFLSSSGIGRGASSAVSIFADDLGTHHCARSPSRLETILQDGAPADPGRARRLREWIVRERLSTYNHLPDRPVRLRASGRRRILLVDQIVGDPSVAASGTNAFRRMWEAARAEPNADIIATRHSSAARNRAKGYIESLPLDGDVQFVDTAVSAHSMLDVVDEVWTVSSPLGFDALLRGIPVVTFGVPAYAGWGLTQDRASGADASAAFARRQRRLSLDDLVDGTLLQYSCYVDPVTRTSTTAERAVERLLLWRRRTRALSGSYLCVDFSFHKRFVMNRYLGGALSRIDFADTPTEAQVAKADAIVLWGNTPVPDAARLAAARSKPILRVEDGFVRSAGLGCLHIPPSSLCFDDDGIYFDATASSRLERLLNDARFDDALLGRASKLRRMIVSKNITKYNLRPHPSPNYRGEAGGRPIVLVAEQVQNDASLRFGMPSHGCNGDLLRAVRLVRPRAFIVYKRHPDVLARAKENGFSPSDQCADADLVVGNVDLDELFNAIDEVHVATSLIGFEALLRQRAVWCYGLPFYAGWGLTQDAVACRRRKRRLSLDALVAGTLILYPQYWSRVSDLPCEVEDVVAELHLARRDEAGGHFGGLARLGYMIGSRASR
jgi:capsular polysaccharide export protein